MKKMHKLSASVLAFCLVSTGLAGCSANDGTTSGGKSVALTIDQLVGSWTFTQGTNADGDFLPVDGSAPTLSFDSDGAAYGSAGCNNFTTTATVGPDEELSFSPIATTLIMCDESVMNVEYSYTAALEGVTSGSEDGVRLTLVGDGVELQFAKD